MRVQIDVDNYDACPQFNDWLDESYTQAYGELILFGYQPRPSYVLHQLSFDTYAAAFNDFQTEQQEQLKETVSNEFPTPIAHYYYRFENGYENDLQRLHLLRDAWEATIDILHALAIGECRFLRLSLTDPISFRHLLSDRISDRLLNIERIINHAGTQGISLSLSRIVPSRILDTMRNLNQSRNAFSHSAAQSEAQARAWVGECYEDVVDVLDELKGLSGVTVMRYLNQVDGRTLRCEIFRGHSFTRTIKSIPLTSEQVRDSQQYFRQGEILAVCDDCVFSVRPLLHFCEDAAGHTTMLCAFRKTHGNAPDRKFEYVVVGNASRRDEDRTGFRIELDELRALFGLGPD